jgi:hypothetical protein
VRDLVEQVVTESIVDELGVLSLSFDTGARIVIRRRQARLARSVALHSARAPDDAR